MKKIFWLILLLFLAGNMIYFVSDQEWRGRVDHAPNETIEVSLFFVDEAILLRSDCSATQEIKISISPSGDVVEATIKELLSGVPKSHRGKGLIDKFYNNGFLPSEIGSLSQYYKRITITRKTAVIDFRAEAMVYLNAAACLQAAVKSPIIKTLQQFPGIDSVEFSIEGQIITEWDA